jgi:hypothetical protein
MRLDARPRASRAGSRILGALAAVLVPLVLAQLPAPQGLSVNGWHAVLVLLGAAIAWLL